jgi:hypothetical protein
MFVGTNKKKAVKGIRVTKARDRNKVLIYKGKDGKYYYSFTKKTDKLFDAVSNVDVAFDACARLNERSNGHK